MAGLMPMFSSTKLFRSGYSLGLVAFVLMAAVGTARAQYFPESVGARGGFSSGGTGTAQFLQGEAFADWNIPLRTESDSGWFLQTKVDLSAGYFSGKGSHAFVGTGGPAVAFGKRGLPLSLEGGISPTFLSQYKFGSVNLGQELQFTSYVGANLDLSRHLRFGYRFQHMSNAGLARSNPGLNLNMFALSYVF
jgi:hypothetical protein